MIPSSRNPAMATSFILLNNDISLSFALSLFLSMCVPVCEQQEGVKAIWWFTVITLTLWKGFKREHEDYHDDAYRMHAFLHECLLGCCNMYVLLRASASQVTHAPHVVCDPAFINLLHAQTYKSLLLIKTCYFGQHVLAVKLLIDWLAECEGAYWFFFF